MTEGVSSLPRDAWNRLVGDESPFLEWEWLASLEETGCVGGSTGWIPRTLVAYKDGELVAACPLYVKYNSEGEFVYDHGWAHAAERAGISYYPKLLVGVPFTPVTGARFLIAEGQDRTQWAKQFGAALRDVCDNQDISGVHVNFCRADEMEALREMGFDARVGFQYHWKNHQYENFEDYLQRFRSKRRNQIRRERRELERQGIRIDFAVGDDIDQDVISHMYRFYLANIENHHYWGRQYLNREFFDLIAERFRTRLQITLARQGEETVAGTLNVFKGDVLYGRYWGTDRPLRHLHFNTCYYAPIEFCIERGLARFEPGAGGEYKQVRGFDAEPTASVHYLKDDRLAGAVRDYLERERRDAAETIEWFRDQSALKPGNTE
ncbi:MAG: GNAT family N-acetyltransferase [Deltaproteobacteria bacterium]|nr:GNAT family N-acetyltransferase [Deltaproteobacteria bacterium]